MDGKQASWRQATVEARISYQAAKVARGLRRYLTYQNMHAARGMISNRRKTVMTCGHGK